LSFLTEIVSLGGGGLINFVNLGYYKKYSMKFSISVPLSIVFAIYLILTVINYPVIETLWRYSFDDGTYSHAYLIPFIVAYLFYVVSQRSKLELRQRFSLPWLVIATITSILLFSSTNAQVSIGYWLSYLALIISITFCLFKFHWQVLFPNVFLIFIIPLWGVLTIPLQSLSVVVVGFIMSLTGIPILIEPPLIHIPVGTFEIAYGCSGLRYVIVSTAISSLYIFLYVSNLQKALLFFAFALFVE
jgi:exosortase